MVLKSIAQQLIVSDQPPERFEVYITRKGPALVSGANRVAILRSVVERSDLNSRAVELCSVTADTKLPKSSIFSTLEDLVKKDVLKYGTVGGKKGYELNSYRIISSTDPVHIYQNYPKDIIDNSPKGYSFYRMLFDHLAAASLGHGIDIGPMMKTLGYDFGKYVRDETLSTKESFEKIKEWVAAIDAGTVELVSRLPLCIEIEFSLPSVSGELARVFSYFVLSAISAVLSEDGTLIIDKVEVDGRKVTGTFVSSPIESDRDIIPSSFNYDDDANADFMLYISSSGVFRGIDNPLGLAILKTMPDNVPMSSAEITKALSTIEKKPQSSVLFYLEKMIDLGLVDDITILGKRKFVKRAGDLYNWSANNAMLQYEPVEHSRESLDHPSTAFGHILSASIRRLGSLRIAIEPVIGRLASALARQFVVMSEKKTIESIMTTIMDKGEWFKFSDTSVTSFVPFTFVRKLPPNTDTLLFNSQLVFDTLFFKTIIHEITGVEYNSQFSEYNSGDNKGYKLIFQLQSR